MATRNIHAVEESAAGATYNKALYWGVYREENTHRIGIKNGIPDTEAFKALKEFKVN